MNKIRIMFPLLVSIIFSACTSDTKSGGDSKDKYEVTKESLEDTEKNNPVRFITVAGGEKKNLLGQTVVKGSLSNNAKIATYKDINIELNFYSKTGALLEKNNETIFETLAPGETKNFKTKYFAPKGTDSVALKVLTAKN